MRQFVRDYELVETIPDGCYDFKGGSAAHKSVVFHCFKNEEHVEVLDIGFGLGHLGQLIKSNKNTSHWQVDGVDGYEVACYNRGLFEKKYYRNVFHGFAEKLRSDFIARYDLICLLDVIEHLDIEAAKFLMRFLLCSMKESARLCLSTPLYYMPQKGDGDDLEEHLIGVPASSMLAMQPLMYASHLTLDMLVGTFVFPKDSLDYIDFFQPTDNRAFTLEKGIRVARSVRMDLTQGTLIFCAT